MKYKMKILISSKEEYQNTNAFLESLSLNEEEIYYKICVNNVIHAVFAIHKAGNMITCAFKIMRLNEFKKCMELITEFLISKYKTDKIIFSIIENIILKKLIKHSQYEVQICLKEHFKMKNTYYDLWICAYSVSPMHVFHRI